MCKSVMSLNEYKDISISHSFWRDIAQTQDRMNLSSVHVSNACILKATRLAVRMCSRQNLRVLWA